MSLARFARTGRVQPAAAGGAALSDVINALTARHQPSRMPFLPAAALPATRRTQRRCQQISPTSSHDATRAGVYMPHLDTQLRRKLQIISMTTDAGGDTHRRIGAAMPWATTSSAMSTSCAQNLTAARAVRASCQGAHTRRLAWCR